MFFGFVPLGSTTFGFPIQVTNSSRTPSTPDAAPTYRIYQAGGTTALLTGTASGSDTDSQTGWRMITGLSITLGNGFASGGTYVVRGAYAISTTQEVDIGSFVVT